jgi:Ni,Fe-hydrogenase III small subunit
LPVISARQRSLFVYHLHMGGPDAGAVEWQALLSPRFEARLNHMGLSVVHSAAEADVVLLTGVLTTHNMDAVFTELARMPSPSVLVAVGDSAINGGAWARLNLPGLAPYPLNHYVHVDVSVPGDPPTPQALLAALAAAADALARPDEHIAPWQEDEDGV